MGIVGFIGAKAFVLLDINRKRNLFSLNSPVGLQITSFAFKIEE